MPRARTAPEAAASRIRLLRTATDLFVRQGYTATTVEQIAAAAGYTIGALYWHFPTKADLFLAAYEDAVDRMAVDMVGRVSSGEATCRERIERALIVVIEGALVHQQGRALHRAYLQEFRGKAKKRVRGFAEQYRIFESEIAKIVEAGVRRGEFPPQDAERAALHIASVVHSLTEAIMEDPAKYDVPELARSTARFCLRALVNTDSASD